jgi:hypothetical protein
MGVSVLFTAAFNSESFLSKLKQAHQYLCLELRPDWCSVLHRYPNGTIHLIVYLGV